MEGTRRLDRIVAIKTLKGPHTGRFEQEARAIAALNQRYPGTLFFVHIIGRSLRESPRWPALAALMNLPST